MAAEDNWTQMATIPRAGKTLHVAVQDFVSAVSEEYIDHATELKCERVATEAVQHFYKVCEEVEKTSESLSDKNKTIQLREQLSAAKEDSSVDIITYQRAVLRFKQRKAQFAKCSRLTRNFVSPRAKKYDPWADDCASPRSRELGEMYCILLPFIVFGLFATGFLLSSMKIGVTSSPAAPPGRFFDMNLKLKEPKVVGLTRSFVDLMSSKLYHKDLSTNTDIQRDIEL